VQHQRLMTLLPALPDEPQPSPIPLQEAIDLVTQELDGRQLQAEDTLLQMLDCKNMEALLQEQDWFDERGPRSKQQLQERTDLPPYMEEFVVQWEAGTISGPYPFDALWRDYFENLYETGARTHSRFLMESAIWETEVRNGLARQRAANLGWEAEPRLLAPQHGGPAIQDLMMQVKEAATPLAKQRVVDQARLAAIDEMGAQGPFSLDAVLRYLAKVLVLDRWAAPHETNLKEVLNQLG